jgi:diacylglycerol O-acyltransferase / wax synthase
LAEPDRLRAVDTIWLDAERPGPSIAIGSVSELEGPAPALSELRDHVASRIDLMPRLQQRLTPSSLRLRRPTWQPCEAELTHHIRQLEIGPAEGPDDLEHAVWRVMEQRLDPKRPLWDLHLVTGLPDGAWGLIPRMHHAVADGAGSVLTLGHLVDVDASGSKTLVDVFTEAVAASSANPQGDARSRSGLVMRAAARGGDRALRALRGSLNPVAATGAVAESALAARRRAEAQVAKSAVGVRAIAAPRTKSLIGGDPGVRRYWRRHQVTLADVKTIRRALGGTVNDVVMTLLSGGYSRMMERRGQATVGEYLKVNIPVSLRAPGDVSSNNQVTALFVQLPLSGTAADRMRWIHDHINTVKDAKTADGLKLIADMLNVAPALIQTAAVRVNGPFPEWMLDTLVTNVPGPPFPVYTLGRHVTRMTPIVALGRPLWCAVAVVSYDGVLNFGISTGEGGEQAGVDIRDGIDQTLQALLAYSHASSPDDSPEA